MDKLVILHIGYADNDKTSGVSVSIPAHIQFQSSKCYCALLNLADIHFTEFTCFLYRNYDKLQSLPFPFNSPSIVVFHELYRLPFLKLYKECIDRKIPYVIIPHGGLTKKAQSIKKIKKIIGNKLFFDKYINKSTCIQFLSIQERNSSIFNKHNNFILGNGINIPEINSADLKKNSQFELLFIGRYDVFFKGIDVLLEAVSEIKSYMISHNIILSLYGKGADEDFKYIDDYIRDKDLEKIVKLNGPVFGNAKIEKYCKANIFIQTSRSEGQPMGILEAMSCYLPILVTPGTTLANVVEEYDIGYVAELNSESIGNAIIEAYEKREVLEKLSLNAKKYVEDNFDGNYIANKAIENYKKILGRDI